MVMTLNGCWEQGHCGCLLCIYSTKLIEKSLLALSDVVFAFNDCVEVTRQLVNGVEKLAVD